MQINHNIAALNTQNQLQQNNKATQGSLEKLSSGLQINKAGDDAAGLAISEKMRGQIRGLEMAEKNAQDGISMIQTAEGALNESHAILQRMRELAVQSSNDTNSDTDRAELQKEVDQLANALNDISEDTEFNTKNLLDGSFEGTFHVGANEDQNLEVSISDMSGTSLKAGFETTEEGYTGNLEALEEGGTYSVVSFEGQDLGDTNEVTGAKYGLQNSDGNMVAISNDGKEYHLLDEGEALEDITSEDAVTADSFSFSEEVANGTVTIGEEYDTDGAGAMGVDITATGGINISSQESADQAITTLNDAIETVSAQRSELGAVQNRLDHTINNLSTSAENLTAAESRIRDTDMAAEMMEFTKNNILSQASQSMLAQANQQPQGVLQLLQ